MTELQLRQNLVNQAKAYLGWAEINGQDDLIIDKYNAIRTPRYKMNHEDSWCAAFVSVVKHEAGLDSIIPTECGCEEMLRLFKALGTYQEDGTIIPQMGDIIFYNWKINRQPNNGWAQHVGIVVSVLNGIIKVIEGNSADKVKYREIKIGDGNIRGYGLPNYKSLEVVPKPQPIPTPQPVPTPQPAKPNPSIVEYRVGNVYTVIVDGLRVRTGPGTNYSQKTLNQLTVDGRKNATSTGQLKKNTKVTCKQLSVDDAGNIWLNIPSGWIAATYNGDTYVR